MAALIVYNDHYNLWYTYRCTYAWHTVVSPVSILTNQPYDDRLIQLLTIHLDSNIIDTLLGLLFVGKLINTKINVCKLGVH